MSWSHGSDARAATLYRRRGAGDRTSGITGYRSFQTGRRLTDARRGPRKFAQVLLDGQDAPVSPGTPGRPYTDATGRQIKVIVDHQYVVNPKSIPFDQCPDRLATVVHERLGTNQKHLFAIDHQTGHLTVTRRHRRTRQPPLRKDVEDKPPDIVARRAVGRTRVPQANDRLHCDLVIGVIVLVGRNAP